MTLYNATDGANWTTSTSWTSEEALSSWFGVATNGDGRVTELALNGNGLDGTLPTALGDLTALEQLDLGDNDLSGSLPSELADLTSLTSLVLNESRALSGPLPDGLRQLADLDTVQVEDTELCAPGDDVFQEWWKGTANRKGLICSPTEQSVIDLAVFYTPLARDTEGGADAIKDAIDLMVATANTAYTNSGLNQRVSLVSVGEVAYTEEQKELDYSRFRTPSDGYMDEVQVIRDRVAADIGVLIRRDSDPRFAYNAATPMTTVSVDFEYHAYAYVDIRSPDVIFAHELGHTMGARHDRYFACGFNDGCRSSAFPYAFGYANQRAFEQGASASTRWRTVMSYDNECTANGITCPRVLYFSSPDRTYAGDPMGVAGFEPTDEQDGPSDVARALNRTRGYVEQFKRAPDITVSFGAARYTATEDGTTASVTVELSADPTRSIDLPLTLVSASATAYDHSGVPSTVHFRRYGAIEQTFTITAVDDAADDDNESVTLSFGEPLPRGVTVGSVSQATVALTDDDAVTGAPSILRVGLTSEPGPDATYALGDEIEASLQFSKVVTVTGEPQLELAVGRAKRLASFDESVGEVVQFTYTVVAGDSDDHGVSLAANSLKLNGGTIRDADDRDAVETHDAVEADPDHLVDGGPNLSPLAEGTLPALTLPIADGLKTVEVSGAFRDPEDDELTYAARSSNASVVTASTADSVVTLTPVSAGSVTITVTATDESGSNTSAMQNFHVVVPNRAPHPVGSVTGPALQVGDGNESVDVAAAFQDPDNDPLTYAASSSAPGVAQARASGSQVVLTAVAQGDATITVTATDVAGSNTPATQTFDVTVKAMRGVTVSRDALTVDEGSTGSYTVVLDSEPTGTVTVTPSVPANRDLSVDPTELTFNTGDWRFPKTVLVEAERDMDTVADAPVTISHEVSGSDYGSVQASTVRVTIVEADAPTLSVEAAEAPESGGTLVFRVTLNRSSSSQVTVDYATSNGSGSAGARAGSDYTAVSGTLTFPVGMTAAQQIVVNITDDADDEEEEETFRLTLSDAQHASLAGGGSTLQVTGVIEDDDDPEVEVSFGSANYGVTEGSTVTVVVRLNRDPERDLDIDLDRSHHGGAMDADYSGVPLSVTFGPGVRTQEFLFAATDDTADDDGEAVVLTFGFLPSRVTGSGETTLAIQDNDGSGPVGPVGPGGPPPDEDDDEDDGGGGAGGGGPPPPSGPPKADFTLTAECPGDLCRARTGLAVTFEDMSTGRVQSRLWDFGDGTGSRNRRIDHVWSSPGFYEVTLSVSGGTTTSTAKQVFLVEASDPAGTCEADAETLCLQDSRYAVGVDWRTADGGSGAASVVHEGTNDSGLFWFFSQENWEILIKVLDGCSLNGHVWVFGASTTDLGYSIRLTDTATGTVKEYRNEPGLPAAAITDVTAFPQGCQQ